MCFSPAMFSGEGLGMELAEICAEPVLVSDLENMIHGNGSGELKVFY